MGARQAELNTRIVLARVTNPQGLRAGLMVAVRKRSLFHDWKRSQGLDDAAGLD
jgi:hypothetical protein